MYDIISIFTTTLSTLISIHWYNVGVLSFSTNGRRPSDSVYVVLVLYFTVDDFILSTYFDRLQLTSVRDYRFLGIKTVEKYNNEEILQKKTFYNTNTDV